MKNIKDLENMSRVLRNPWERDQSLVLNGKLSYGKIYSVNAANRTCSVKTFGSDPLIGDSDFINIQWLNPFSSIEGGEISFVPTVGSFVVIAIVDGLAWIIGFFHPITLSPDTQIIDKELDGVDPSGASASQNKERINPGDFILRTDGNCRLVLRRGGEIEIESTKQCKTTYFPARNLINTLCQNYEFRTAGGSIDWVQRDKNSEDTVYVSEYRDSIERRNIIRYEKGTVEPNKEIIYRFSIGPGVDTDPENGENFTPTYKQTIYNNGRNELKVNDLKYIQKIDEFGNFSLGIGSYKFYELIGEDGSQTININNKIQMSAISSGDFYLDIGIEAKREEDQPPEGGEGKFTLHISPKGDVDLGINKKISLKLNSDGNITLDSGGGKSVIKIDPTGKVSIETTTDITLKTPTANLTAGKINLGEKVSDVVPMGRMLLSAINKFIASYNTHTHDFITPAPGNPGVVFPTKATQQQLKKDILSETVTVQP